MIHKGKVVYESYPGMRPSDRHLTSSTGKVTCGLVITQLIKEGKIDEKKNIADYIPDLKNTGLGWRNCLQCSQHVYRTG